MRSATDRLPKSQGQESERKLARSLLLARMSLDSMCFRARERSSKVGRSLGSFDRHCLPSLHTLRCVSTGSVARAWAVCLVARARCPWHISYMFRCALLAQQQQSAFCSVADCAKHSVPSRGCRCQQGVLLLDIRHADMACCQPLALLAEEQGLTWRCRAWSTRGSPTSCSGR